MRVTRAGENPLQHAEGLGKLETEADAGVSLVFCSLSVPWPYSPTLLSGPPELPEAALPLCAQRFVCPTTYGSRLPFRRRSSWNKRRGGRADGSPSPELSEPGAEHRCSGSRLATSASVKPRDFRAATPPADLEIR